MFNMNTNAFSHDRILGGEINECFESKRLPNKVPRTILVTDST